MQSHEIIEALNREFSKKENIFNTEGKMSPVHYRKVTCTIMTLNEDEDQVSVRISSPAIRNVDILNKTKVELTNVDTAKQYTKQLDKYSGTVIHGVDRGRYWIKLYPPES